jgi:hypothetical protein
VLAVIAQRPIGTMPGAKIEFRQLGGQIAAQA